MDKGEFVKKMAQMLEDVKNGILATAGTDGFPSMRWMTPTLIRGQEGSLFAVTASSFPKIQAFEAQNKVSWLFTSNRTGEILSLRGHIKPVDDPRFKSEILEELSRSLENFWKLNEDPSNLVCLQTHLISGEYFNPKAGTKVQVTF